MSPHYPWRRRARVALALALAPAVLGVVAACTGGGTARPDAGAPPDGQVADDAGWAPDAGPPPDDGPVAPATHGSLDVDFRADLTGAGTVRLGTVGVTDDVAAAVLDGVDHVGIAYAHHVWAGYTLYDVVSLATDGSNLAVTYLYCQGSALPYAYTESFTDAMDYEVASGTCSGSDGQWSVTADLPALTAVPTPLDTGITIAGTDVDLGAAGGHVDLGGATWRLVPFNTVDCTTCPGGPWYEIHSVLLRAGEACFTILYLYPDQPGTVQLALTLCLPTLATPDAVYDATWSGTLRALRARRPPWRPTPPPLAAMREVHGRR